MSSVNGSSPINEATAEVSNDSRAAVAETPKTPVPKTVRVKRDLRSATEILLERQVNLVEEQVVCLQAIRRE